MIIREVKTLLTGATGFIGSHVARSLVQRGDDLRVTVREHSDQRAIDDLEAERRKCDVLDRAAVRRALKGVDRVVHAAGVTSMRPADAERMFEVNVQGTRVVMEECLRAGVERVVLVSSAATFGPASGEKTADETQLFTGGHLGIPYVSSVHEGEGAALALAAQGLPLVCANPTATFGPGDLHVTSTRLVRSFLLGKVPAYADGAVNIVDVRDAAEGILLADADGEVGERYILGGRNFTFDRLFADLSRLTGVAQPVKVPTGVAALAAGVMGFGPGRTVLTSAEVAAASRRWTYSSAKAKRELGFVARPHDETLQATVDWYMDQDGDRIARSRRTMPLRYRGAGVVIGAGDAAFATGKKLVGGLIPGGGR